MNLSVNITQDQKKAFLDEYSKYIKKALKDGYAPYSQSKFFMEIYDFWIENKDKISKKS